MQFSAVLFHDCSSCTGTGFQAVSCVPEWVSGGVKQLVPPITPRRQAAKSWSKLDKALGRTSAWAGRSALRPIPRLGLRGVLRCVQRRQRGVYQVLRGGDGSCREWGLGGDMGDLGNR
jgi:hypothetical protein